MPRCRNLFVHHTLLELIQLFMMHFFYCGKRRVSYARKENELHDYAQYALVLQNMSEVQYDSVFRAGAALHGETAFSQQRSESCSLRFRCGTIVSTEQCCSGFIWCTITDLCDVSKQTSTCHSCVMTMLTPRKRLLCHALTCKKKEPIKLKGWCEEFPQQVQKQDASTLFWNFLEVQRGAVL